MLNYQELTTFNTDLSNSIMNISLSYQEKEEKMSTTPVFDRKEYTIQVIAIPELRVTLYKKLQKRHKIV